jgi:hypothetical protein
MIEEKSSGVMVFGETAAVVLQLHFSMKKRIQK